MAIPLLKHSHISRKSQAPGTAAAHIRYITRQSATVLVYSERMPRQYHAAQRFMDTREQGIRKDGRVCDKFIIAVPREMKQEEACDVIRKFGQRLTKGRAPFLFTLQDWGSPNPHAHFVLVDADIETGRRVVKTTDLNSSERIKIIWEETCNGELSRLGYEERISFADAADKKRQREASERPEVPLAPEPETMPSSDQEASMVIEREGEHPSHVHVKDALEYDTELGYLHTVQAQIKSYEDAKAQADADHDRLTEIAGENRRDAQAAEREAYRAGEALKAYTRPDGSLKGFHIQFWKIDIKTPKRARGEELTSKKSRQEFLQAVAEQNAKDAAYAAEIAERHAQEALEASQAKQRELDELTHAYGEHATLETAEKVLSASVQNSLGKVDLQEIYADFENGELTGEQAKRAFELLGEHEMAAAVEQRMAIEEEMDPTGAYANDNEVEI
jgi:relaxase-like protein